MITPEFDCSNEAIETAWKAGDLSYFGQLIKLASVDPDNWCEEMSNELSPPKNLEQAKILVNLSNSDAISVYSINELLIDTFKSTESRKWLNTMLDLGLNCRVEDWCYVPFLCRVIEAGDKELLTRVVKEGKANINVETECGYSVLLTACCSGDYEMVKLCLDLGADPNAVCLDYYFWMDAFKATPEILQLLFDRGFKSEIDTPKWIKHYHYGRKCASKRILPLWSKIKAEHPEIKTFEDLDNNREIVCKYLPLESEDETFMMPCDRGHHTM